MVLFDEDPITLIRTTTLNFHSHSDISSLERAKVSLTTIRAARTHRLDDQRCRLATLTRQVRNAQQVRDDMLESHDLAGHAQEVLRLDGDKFRVAKNVSEVRAECERRDGEVRALRSQRVEMEKNGDVDGRGSGDGESDEEKVQADESLLKLRVYRNLGIDVDVDKSTGEWNQAVIANRERGDVSVVGIDRDGLDGTRVNTVWDKL